MDIQELKQLCDDAEEFYRESLLGIEIAPRFSVIIPEYRYGQTVRVLKGLTGRNLGHLPPKGTLVSLEVTKVRKWLKANGL